MTKLDRSTNNVAPKRICLIITGLSTGGAETMLLKLLQNIDRSTFEPHVVSLTDCGEIGQSIMTLGIPVLCLRMRKNISVATSIFRLRNYLAELKPDLVHTWMYHADLVGGLAARSAGINNVIWGIRHSNLSIHHNRLTTLIIMKICAHLSNNIPKIIVSCSERAKSIHVRAGYCSGKMVVIPNGFDLNKFKPNVDARRSVRAELGLAQQTIIVGHVARNDPQKNHLGFIEAAAAVHNKLSNVHFVMAGAGIDEQNSRLVGEIIERGLQHNMHLLGQRSDIPRLMASFDLLASSSIGEAFPNVLGEAMACAIPCVVTDVGDSAEIVGDTGRAVSPTDMHGLAEKIISIIQNGARYRSQLGKMARQRIYDQYDIKRITASFEGLYGHAAKGN